MREQAFQQQVIQWLKSLPNCRYFVKEAKSIRGIADIIGCLNGLHFELEVKKSKSEIMGSTGRHILQAKELWRCRNAGGFGEFVYPENFEEVKTELIRRSIDFKQRNF